MTANLVNEFGRLCHDRGHLGLARSAYALATVLAPSWSAPWFNRGLIAKFERRWPDCRKFNRRAAELSPNDPPAWWNLGIAATALGDWDTAREAWSRYGIKVPAGTGPIDMNLGPVPIRVSPHERPEVVWCRRLDPARALIRSVPTPESGRGYGDTVLHDGEPKGKRLHTGREVSVFDELELLSAGRLATFAVAVVAPVLADMEELEAASIEDTLVIEDWPSNVQMICHSCSEGRPHEHHAPESESPWQPNRVVGVAAASEDAVRAGVQQWADKGAGRRIDGLERVLPRTPA